MDRENDNEINKNSAETVMSRRSMLGASGVLLGGGFLTGGAGSMDGFFGKSGTTDGFDPIEASASEIRSGYLTERFTVRSVVTTYLDRILTYEPELESIITVNPEILERADELDAALESDGPVGPLHGIPVILKDNNDTADMPTTAGAVILQDFVPPEDATLVEKIRDAGGIILAKANLHEFAFSYDSISSLGGVTRNPYDVERSAGGSSSGSGAAIAANFGVLSTGTDTGGSVRVPAAANCLVGLRPSTGLISRSGIIPLSLTDDTAGPMTRTVAEAALMTDTMAGYDPDDPVTAESEGRTPHADGKQYTDYLNESGLEEARIGVYRDYVGPGTYGDEPDDDLDEAVVEDAHDVAAVFDQALADIEKAGGTVVDPVESPPSDLVFAANVDTEMEFNRDINDYLAELGDDAPADLAEIVASDEYSPANCPTIREREEVDEDAVDENLDYLQKLNRVSDLQQFVLSTMIEHDLDAIVYPALTQSAPLIDSDEPWGANAQLTPALDFPSMTVPAGFADGTSMPVGIEFMGRKFDEARLFELTYAYEQATQHRQPPGNFGPIKEADGDWSREMIDEWNDDQRRDHTVANYGCDAEPILNDD